MAIHPKNSYKPELLVRVWSLELSCLEHSYTLARHGQPGHLTRWNFEFLVLVLKKTIMYKNNYFFGEKELTIANLSIL